METTDIVIHKGEKDKKYQLYVEDYVMSYLKNYGSADGRKIFFYGTREQKNKRYYIYGAGRQKNISYFVRYELLDEIVCRFDMDMPVFSVKEDSKRYELSGYYIFYQSNDAMQSYMVEQHKENGSPEKEPDKFSDIRMRKGLKASEEKEEIINSSVKSKQTYVQSKKEKGLEKSKGGILAFQLAAVFLILAAIIINSTNSYSKLQELGQSAVEVFFTMENQEASMRNDGEVSGSEGESEVLDVSEVSDVSEGTILRLEDLDAELEKENLAAKKEGTDDDVSEIENSNEDKTSEDGKTESDKNEISEDKKNESEKNDKGEVDKSENSKVEINEDKENNTDNENKDDNNRENTNNAEEDNKAGDINNETPQSQEAFARNLTEYYQIEKGDTLCTISIKKYGDASKVKEICEINKIEDPDNIKYGQKIILP